MSIYQDVLFPVKMTNYTKIIFFGLHLLSFSFPNKHKINVKCHSFCISVVATTVICAGSYINGFGMSDSRSECCCERGVICICDTISGTRWKLRSCRSPQSVYEHGPVSRELNATFQQQ